MGTPRSDRWSKLSAAGFRISLGRDLAVWMALVLLLLALYTPIFVRLVEQWWDDPNYSHGFLVPMVVVYLGWRKKEVLAELPRQPTLWGMATIIASQAILFVGVLGAELFLQRFSFLLLLVGTILFLYGWAHVRASLFPLALLLFMIPLPAIIFNAIAGPLQLIASEWAEGFLRLCQVPVFREGNILILAHQALNVTEACSGIRSLFSLFTLTLIIAYFLPISLWLRGLFVLTALPITLLTNSLRVAGTGILGQWWGPEAAEGFFHTFSGWLVFLLALVLMFLEFMVLERWRRWRAARKEDR